jgi:hypothetical protein
MNEKLAIFFGLSVSWGLLIGYLFGRAEGRDSERRRHIVSSAD